MTKKLIIAVDGPSASGKGTLCASLSKKFNIPSLNTGALYRYIAYETLNRNLDINNVDEVLMVAKNIKIEELNNPELFTEDVGSKASIVARMQPVRDALLQYQKDFANTPGGAILDGRDIGTVICPDAPYKFFVTASAEERANRRYKEMLEKGQEATYEEILEKIKERDEKDMNREASPFKKADDAIEIDTTGKTKQEVLEEVLGFFESLL